MIGFAKKATSSEIQCAGMRTPRVSKFIVAAGETAFLLARGTISVYGPGSLSRADWSLMRQLSSIHFFDGAMTENGFVSRCLRSRIRSTDVVLVASQPMP